VSETFNPQGEMFGRERVSQLLRECQELTTEQTVQRLDDALVAYRGEAPQHDDVTVVLIELT